MSWQRNGGKRMDKERILKIRASKEAAKNRQYANFQSTGDDNYYRKYTGYDDIVTICDMALNSADDHTTALNLKGEIAQIASRASDLEHEAQTRGELDSAEARGVLRAIMTLAKKNGWWNRWE